MCHQFTGKHIVFESTKRICILHGVASKYAAVLASGPNPKPRANASLHAAAFTKSIASLVVGHAEPEGVLHGSIGIQYGVTTKTIITARTSQPKYYGLGTVTVGMLETIPRCTQTMIDLAWLVSLRR